MRVVVSPRRMGDVEARLTTEVAVPAGPGQFGRPCRPCCYFTSPRRVLSGRVAVPLPCTVKTLQPPAGRTRARARALAVNPASGGGALARGGRLLWRARRCRRWKTRRPSRHGKWEGCRRGQAGRVCHCLRCPILAVGGHRGDRWRRAVGPGDIALISDGCSPAIAAATTARPFWEYALGTRRRKASPPGALVQAQRAACSPCCNYGAGPGPGRCPFPTSSEFRSAFGWLVVDGGC